MLARELGFEILEWRNAIHLSEARHDNDNDEDTYRSPGDHETLFAKFEAFLTRASACQSIFAPPSHTSFHSSHPSQSHPSQSQSEHPSGSQVQQRPRRQIILLEDLPNILHPKTQDQFHAALTFLCSSPSSTVPVVIVVSDAGTRGEARDETMASGIGWGGGKDVVDIRSVLPGTLLNSAFVTHIASVFHSYIMFLCLC